VRKTEQKSRSIHFSSFNITSHI